MTAPTSRKFTLPIPLRTLRSSRQVQTNSSSSSNATPVEATAGNGATDKGTAQPKITIYNPSTFPPQSEVPISGLIGLDLTSVTVAVSESINDEATGSVITSRPPSISPPKTSTTVVAPTSTPSAKAKGKRKAIDHPPASSEGDIKPTLAESTPRKRTRLSTTATAATTSATTINPVTPLRIPKLKSEPHTQPDAPPSPSSSILTDVEDLPLPFTPVKPDPTSVPLNPELELKLTPHRTPSSAKSKKPTIKLALDKPHPEPKNWRRQYELIEEMRRGIRAPVDTMGCETPSGERTDDPKTIRFHILISLMLSSQTKDPVTSSAVTNLHNSLPSGLTASSLASASPDLISSCINKVGFWRRKTEYIQEAADFGGGLDEGEEREREDDGRVVGDEMGDIPRTLGGLCKLKGVGPKMAFLALSAAWQINAGIGVDVHVHRITNRLGWHKPKTTEPEQTRLNLQSWLPTHLFKPINHMLVGFGQVVCLPVGPRCDVCTLAKEKVCPSRVANVNAKGRKVVEFGFLAKEEVKPEVGGEGEGMELDLSRVRAKVEVEIEREGDGVKYEELVDVNTLAGSGLNEEERRLVEGAVESGVEGISAVEALGRIAEARGEVLVKVEAPDL